MVQLWVQLSCVIPSIRGMSGPCRSASRSPTRPDVRRLNAKARFSAMVDLPTPPLPLPTMMVCRASETFADTGPD